MISFKTLFRVVAVMLSCFSWYTVNSQCNIEFGPDTMVCIHPIYLDAGGNYDNYLWQDGSTASDFTVTVPGIYTVLAETTGPTVVVNGHFENGNVGFISGYTYNATSVWNEGTYWVGPNANNVHPNFTGLDHTPPPGVNFFVCNGASTAGVVVWGQSISVTPNTDYKFSAWVSSLVTASPAQLQFSINNITLGSIFTAPSTLNTWSQFFVIWNSGLNTTANISIVNQLTTGSGNDFGLDDISFRPIIICGDTIIVNPNNLNVVATGINVDCFGDNSGGATLTVTGGYSPYTYLWSDNSVQAELTNAFSGTYTVTVTDATDCEATASVVVNEPASVVSGSLVISPVTCFGGDDGEINLTVSGGNFPYTYHWSTNQNIEDISNLNAGMYSVTITDDHGCKAIEQVEMTQPDELLVDLSGTDLSCHGDTDAFANAVVSGGVLNYTYNWNTGANTSGITNLAAGVYTVTVIDANYCTATASIEFEEPNPVQLYTSADQTICLSNEANILGNSFGGTTPYTYHWTPGGYSDPSIFVSPSESTEYCVYVIDDNGCRSSTKCISVFVNPALEFELTIDEDTICLGDTIMLSSNVSGGDGGPYFLEFYDGPIIDNPQMLTPDATTKYVVIVSDGCGTPSKADTVQVSVFDPPAVSFRSNILQGCEPLEVEFILNIEEAGSEYFWDFDDSPIYNYSVEANPLHLFRDPGVYDISLSVKSSVGCTASYKESSMIEVFPKPRSIFYYEPEATSISDPVVYFVNQSEYAFISLWNFGDGDSIVGHQPGDHVYKHTGDFLVSLITESIHGCRDTSYQWLSIDNINTFYAPNALQPFSGNDENRVFKPAILNLATESYKLLIYNRWGELIFQNTNYSAGWNGRIDGEVVKQGSYVWLISYKDIFGNSFQKTGSITVIY